MGDIDNTKMFEVGARLLLAEAHAVNVERQNQEEIIQDQAAA